MTSLDAHVVKWLELQLGVGGGGREEGRLWKSTTLRKDTCQLTLLYTKDKNLHHQRCSLTVTLKQGHQYPPLGNHGSTLCIYTSPSPASVASPSSLSWHQSFNSLAIFEAMFLKPMDVPEILLKRTPFRERRGSLHTSISHCTKLSVLGSPCTHSSKNFSRCS